MKSKDKYKKWLYKLKKSAKTEEEFGRIILGVAKYSEKEIYQAMVVALTNTEIKEIESIENNKKAKEKMEELFKKRTGMTIDKLVGSVQIALIEKSSYLEILKKIS